MFIILFCASFKATQKKFHFQVGPAHPFKTQQQRAVKNVITGFAEPAHVNAFQFENERRTFHSYGKF